MPVSGCFWACGNLCALLATQYLGDVLGYPVTQTAICERLACPCAVSTMLLVVYSAVDNQQFLAMLGSEGFHLLTIEVGCRYRWVLGCALLQGDPWTM